MTRTLAVALCGLAFVGCQPEESPVMMPGHDCVSCHDGTGEAPRWSVAGTLYGDPHANASDGVDGAEVLVTDSAGRALTLRSNSAGNFYTAEDLKPPFTVEVQRNGRRMAMSMPAPSGSCNSCHGNPPRDDAPGRLFAP